ncbi:DUF3649 domain-containing protein [Teichococcus aestuarii]|uniref:Iron transporter n=1 Tax=Teichococcus aestuarii TaxID=568898 RepID=A0A2U1V0U8_9PROT|nr:DUF3649 domain-containing protein [Pseudoroseomonas aestuarii]PWC27524.1 hypothetical protein CR165_17060 [Pseudoroseomonas aestuarii]
MPGFPAGTGRAFRTRLPPGAALRRAMGIALRVLAGAGGGYAVAALFTAALSLGLPMPRAEAVLTATMASFAVYAAAIVWAFAAPGVLRAWAGLAAVAAALALVLFLLQGHLP